MPKRVVAPVKVEALGLVLPAKVSERLTLMARERGVTPDELARAVLALFTGVDSPDVTKAGLSRKSARFGLGTKLGTSTF